jgi:hypothetical protein
MLLQNKEMKKIIYFMKEKSYFYEKRKTKKDSSLIELGKENGTN